MSIISLRTALVAAAGLAVALVAAVVALAVVAGSLGENPPASGAECPPPGKMLWQEPATTADVVVDTNAATGCGPAGAEANPRAERTGTPAPAQDIGG